jgi:hypothetical protein
MDDEENQLSDTAVEIVEMTAAQVFMHGYQLIVDVDELEEIVHEYAEREDLDYDDLMDEVYLVLDEREDNL